MSKPVTWRYLFRLLRWDLLDRSERRSYTFWLMWQIPGAFGIQLRARYVGRQMKSVGQNLKILPGCRFRSIEKMQVGNNVAIGFDNFLQARGGLTIGDNVTTAPGVKIWSVNHEYDDPDTPVSQQGITEKPVVIGNNVFIASNAFILPGATIPEGCIISAGAVVGGKVYRPFSILAGNPARMIGQRGGAERMNDAAGHSVALPGDNALLGAEPV